MMKGDQPQKLMNKQNGVYLFFESARFDIISFNFIRKYPFSGYDDTLDVFGIHGIAGITGAIMTGIFATNVINPIFKDASGNSLSVGLVDGNPMQIVNQLVAVGLTILLASVGSFLILKVVDLVLGLRVSQEHEIAGLDTTQHDEVAYVYATQVMEVFSAPVITFEEPGMIPSTELAFETGE